MAKTVSAESIHWAGTLDAAAQQAKSTGKFVLLDFFSPT